MFGAPVPGVPRVFYYGRWRNRNVLAMELLGDSLHGMMQRAKQSAREKLHYEASVAQQQHQHAAVAQRNGGAPLDEHYSNQYHSSSSRSAQRLSLNASGAATPPLQSIPVDASACRLPLKQVLRVAQRCLRVIEVFQKKKF